MSGQLDDLCDSLRSMIEAIDNGPVEGALARIGEYEDEVAELIQSTGLIHVCRPPGGLTREQEQTWREALHPVLRRSSVETDDRGFPEVYRFRYVGPRGHSGMILVDAGVADLELESYNCATTLPAENSAEAAEWSQPGTRRVERPHRHPPPDEAFVKELRHALKGWLSKAEASKRRIEALTEQAQGIETKDIRDREAQTQEATPLGPEARGSMREDEGGKPAPDRPTGQHEEASRKRDKADHSTPGCAYPTKCADEAKRRGGAWTAWSVARERGEEYIRNHPFPGLKELARRCGCHHSVMRRAISNSRTLPRAEAAHKLQRARPPIASGPVDDPTWQSQVDEALRVLIENAPETERAKLNTSEMREQLAAMEPDDLAALVNDARGRPSS